MHWTRPRHWQELLLESPYRYARNQRLIPSLLYLVKGSGKQSSPFKGVKSTSELWQVLGREVSEDAFKDTEGLVCQITGRGAKVWICCVMRSIVPKAGRLSQRLCCSASLSTTSRNKSKLSSSNLEKSHCSPSGNPLPGGHGWKVDNISNVVKF